MLAQTTSTRRKIYAVRKIRIDLGVSIEFPSGIHIDRKLGTKSKRCAIGVIRYDLVDQGAEDGLLLYIKPVITGDEPADVRNYACANSQFPQEPTSEQWFSEAQFESYRRLGAFSLEEILAGSGAWSIDELFEKARTYLASGREELQSMMASNKG
jgi:hypothetical protein